MRKLVVIFNRIKNIQFTYWNQFLFCLCVGWSLSWFSYDHVRKTFFYLQKKKKSNVLCELWAQFNIIIKLVILYKVIYLATHTYSLTITVLRSSIFLLCFFFLSIDKAVGECKCKSKRNQSRKLRTIKCKRDSLNLSHQSWTAKEQFLFIQFNRKELKFVIFFSTHRSITKKYFYLISNLFYWL